MDVLGVAVDGELRRRWSSWLAPQVQPFVVASRRGWPVGGGRASFVEELRHTYRWWRIDRSLPMLWLDEASFMDLPRGRRADLVRFQVACGRGAVPSVRRWSDVVDDPSVVRAQADGHRFVWWPSLLTTAVLSRVVLASPDGAAPAASPSRHREVARSAWAACAAAGLPAARDLAGSFPPSSGPNCFGTVLAAAGVPRAATACVVEETFLGWLAGRCRPWPRGPGADDAPGTVLVWRDARSVPVHAAVTIGDGWALEKASGEWWTPRAVRPVDEVIRATRLPGQRLERHRLARGG